MRSHSFKTRIPLSRNSAIATPMIASIGANRSTTEYTPQETLNAIERYKEDMRINGKPETSRTSITRRLKGLAKHQEIKDFNNPYEIKDFLSSDKCKLCDNSKRATVADYDGYLKFIGKTWNKPKYRAEEKIIFIPREDEIDALINSAGKTIAPLLQFLKETLSRIGEATKVEWKDLDTLGKTVAINHPEKGSLPRLLPVSPKLILMLQTLPQTNKPIFCATSSAQGLRITFEHMRKRTAIKLQNPRLMQIHFHTFRHWGATKMFTDLQDSLLVRTKLGHKTATMSDRYIHIAKTLIDLKDENWTSIAIDQNDPNVLKITMEATNHGYTKTDEVANYHIYRKRA